MSDPVDVPIYINIRDRVSDLRKLVAWLEAAGQGRIILLDNDSTYEPLQQYLAESPHEVHRLGENLGSKALWTADLVPQEHFVYTDPDLLPIEACPQDVISRLRYALDLFGPEGYKAGLGLFLDDLSPDLEYLPWERSLVRPERQLAEGVFDSLIDTTFALYRPGASFGYAGLRLGFPYQARHSSWYMKIPDEENRYYLERARPGREGSSWAEKAVLC